MNLLLHLLQNQLMLQLQHQLMLQPQHLLIAQLHPQLMHPQPQLPIHQLLPTHLPPPLTNLLILPAHTSPPTNHLTNPVILLQLLSQHMFPPLPSQLMSALLLLHLSLPFQLYKNTEAVEDTITLCLQILLNYLRETPLILLRKIAASSDLENFNLDSNLQQFLMTDLGIPSNFLPTLES